MGAMTDAMLGGQTTSYDADYHAWTQDQAAKLRDRDFATLDVKWCSRTGCAPTERQEAARPPYSKSR